MLIIDTCSWHKIQRLEREGVILLKDFFYETDLHATHELVKEYLHYLKEYLDLSKFTIQPVQLEAYHDLTKKSLDDADLSIIALSRKNANAVVICDDGAETDILHFFHVKAFRISEYMLWLIYSVNVTGLTPGTTYSFRAYAINGHYDLAAKVPRVDRLDILPIA